MKRILVVDDYQTNGLMLKQILEERQYDVLIATSGKKALAILNTVKPDLILLDIGMPDMDGIETLVKIREIDEFKELPIVFLTGIADRNNVVKGYQLGVLDVIAKPIVPMVALERIERVLSGKSLVQRNRKKLESQLDGIDLNQEELPLPYDSDLELALSDTSQETASAEVIDTKQDPELEHQSSEFELSE